MKNREGRAAPGAASAPAGAASAPAGARVVAPPSVVEVPADYSGDWRPRLRAEALKVRRARQRQEVLIAQAIAAGATWSAIGLELGCSRQAAQQRFRHVRIVVCTAD